MARPDSAFKTMGAVGSSTDGIGLGFTGGRRIFPMMTNPAQPKAPPAAPSPPESLTPESPTPASPGKGPTMPKEVGGPQGPEPTRHGDWHYKGRCTDF